MIKKKSDGTTDKRKNNGGKTHAGGRPKKPQTLLKEQYKKLINDELQRGAVNSIRFLCGLVKDKDAKNGERTEACKILLNKCIADKSPDIEDDDREPFDKDIEYLD